MPGVLQAIQGAWSKADEQLGGWLPGGGTASPATRAVFPPQAAPGRSRELESATGVRARIIDPEKTPSLVRRVAPRLNPAWGDSDYANPLLGEVGISGYRGGKTERERYVEMHELGHIDDRGKEWYSRAGVLGRTLEGLSNATGNLPPLDIAAGMAMRELDAREEDRADRFAAYHLRKTGESGPVITPSGRSAYGDKMRRGGQELIDRGIAGIKDPFGVVSAVRGGLTQVQAAPLQAEMSALEPRLKELIVRDGDGVSPELLELSKRHTNIRNRLESMGIDPDKPR
jgi:hypothetical protein